MKETKFTNTYMSIWFKLKIRREEKNREEPKNSYINPIYIVIAIAVGVP